jgi:phosphate starvation-inducible PhoH-like protein
MAKPKKTNDGSVEIGSAERKIEFKKREFKFSPKQTQLLETLLNEDTKIVFISGPAGSSKTYMAIYAAMQLMANDKAMDMLYIRSIAESADKGIGSLPGDMNEKFLPFAIPLEDKLDEIVTAPTMLNLKKENSISVLPINFVRGSNWTNKVVVADECQNFSRKELTTLLTRIGKNAKLFLCGDLMQSDIKQSGFCDMITVFEGEDSAEKGIHVFKFGKEDIYRSEILKFIIEKIESLPALPCK